MVTHVSRDGSRIYANIESVVPASKGAVIKPQAELLHYDQDNPDPAIRQRLPEWITKLLDSAVTSSKPDSAIPPQPAVTAPAKEEANRDFNDDLNF